MVRVGLDDGTLVEVSGDDLHDGDQVVIGDAGDGSDPRKAPPPNQQQRRPPGLHF
jgi:hypothetical protein